MARFVITYGSLAKGITIVGPYPTQEAAVTAAFRKQPLGGWEILPLFDELPDAPPPPRKRNRRKGGEDAQS